VGTAIKEKASAASPSGFPSAAEFREVIDAALSELDSDERTGPLIRATGMRMRFELPDISTVLNVAVGEATGKHLRWGFSDGSEWDPKLRMRMDSDVANRFLQGRESLAIAIARGRVRCEGEPRYTLLYIPALRLLVDPYRHAVRRRQPELALD
jgi:hypothetical protein